MAAPTQWYGRQHGACRDGPSMCHAHTQAQDSVAALAESTEPGLQGLAMMARYDLPPHLHELPLTLALQELRDEGRPITDPSRARCSNAQFLHVRCLKGRCHAAGILSTSFNHSNSECHAHDQLMAPGWARSRWPTPNTPRTPRATHVQWLIWLGSCRVGRGRWTASCLHLNPTTTGSCTT